MEAAVPAKMLFLVASCAKNPCVVSVCAKAGVYLSLETSLIAAGYYYERNCVCLISIESWIFGFLIISDGIGDGYTSGCSSRCCFCWSS